MSQQCIALPVKLIAMDFEINFMSCLRMFFANEDEIYSDISVEVGDKIFPCHRVILAAFSPYFQGLLRFPFDKQEIKINSIKLKEVSSEAFELIHAFLYHHKNGLNEENVMDVWKAADFLQIDLVTSACKRFAMMTVNAMNCDMYYPQAKLLDEDLTVKIIECITYNFDQLKDKVMELEGEHLLSVVRDPNLKTSREENVVETIFKWVSHRADDPCTDVACADDSCDDVACADDSCDDVTCTESKDTEAMSRQFKSMTVVTATGNLRGDFLVPMLSESRLTSLSRIYLLNLLRHNLVENNTNALDLISKASKYTPGGSPTFWPAFASHRRCSHIEDLVLMPSLWKCIVVFSLIELKTVRNVDVPLLPSGAALFVFRGEFFACGYTTNKKCSLSMFKYINGVWQRITNVHACDTESPQECEIQSDRQALQCFLLDNQVPYVVNVTSGSIFSSDCMNCLSLKPLTSVPTGMRIMYAACYESYILAISEAFDNSPVLNVYDTVGREWKSPVFLKDVCVKGISSFYKEDELYFMTSQGKLYLTRHRRGKFTLKHVATIFYFNYRLIGALVYCRDLFLFVKSGACMFGQYIIPNKIELAELFNKVYVIGSPNSCTSFISASLFP